MGSHTLGQLSAEIAELEGRRQAFREELIRRGVSEVEGALFRATVSEAVRWTIDSAKVKAEMGVVVCPLPAIAGHDGCGEGPHRLREAGGIGRAQQCQTRDITTATLPAFTGP